ncbi:SlyX family protein [Lampropedia puyangensis]|uniref:SlyX family protein n=1 Tax=Lampropedia puyangensis TaxID=1330072 RepID=A0A4V4GRL6_9BURK|nr:SlyX family protein [Lampropedia puyangensis]THU02726.1 SlyX family protein [Lampropedia puyangensis]
MTSTPPLPQANTLPAHIETRLTDLEIKQSYNDDLLEQLNLLVYKQQAQIDTLTAQVQRLQQVQSSSSAEGTRDPRDELPPHY